MPEFLITPILALSKIFDYYIFMLVKKRVAFAALFLRIKQWMYLFALKNMVYGALNIEY